MKKSTISLIAVFLFALVTTGSFYWLWTISKTESAATSTIATNYTVVEIESVKKEAVNILSGLENKATIPIAVPTEKMGRVNPYVAY